MPKDYYKILGVERNASQDDIKSAYKKLAKKLHPDVNKDADATDKFKEVNEAAAVLGNAEKRQHYDQYGTTEGPQFAEGFDFSNFGGFSDFEDLFSMFTGGGRRRGPARGRDLLYDIDIDLEEVVKGTTKDIKFQRLAPCEECNGSGARKESDIVTCETCGGAGLVRETRRTPFGIVQTTAACRACGGQGTTIKHPCPKCDGAGATQKQQTIEVRVPAGVEDGMRLRVPGQGEAGPRGSSSGDLYVAVHVREHERFEREGDDILLTIDISFGQAALGAEIDVPTLEEEATLKIPAGTQPGTVLRMRDYGLPSVRGRGRGDQLVRINVVVPTKLSKKQEELIRELEGGESKKKGKKGWLGL